MKRWKIEYYDSKKEKSSIESWLNRLSKDQFKSLAKELIMLEYLGNELKLPHSKALGQSLFELRERRFGLRIYYTFFNNLVIIVLATGNKKSQKKDIAIARKRLIEIEEDLL